MCLEPKNRTERRMKKSKKFRKVLAAYEDKASNHFLVNSMFDSEFLLTEGKVGEVGRHFRKPKRR
jgi:hypothetical protein